MSRQSRSALGVRRFAARRRALRRVVIAVVMVLVTVFGLPLGAATAYQVATSVTQAGQVVTGNTPSGWTWKVTTAGQNTVLDSVSSPGTYAATSAMFTPAIATTSPMDRISTALGACPAVGLCSGLGTITIDFSQPVRNPVLHIMGVGAQASNGSNGSIFHVVQTLSSSTPAGATLGAPSAGASNLTVTGGTVIDATNYLASTSCGNLTTGATALSVCGSVPVVGTVTSITLTTTAQAQKYAGNGTTSSGAADAWGILVTAPQDFGDAPATYDAGSAATNIVGDLKLGSTIDEDNAAVPNSPSSPNAVATGANANGANGDGADEDALSSWPALTTANIGSAYAVTVPISGASKTGQVCGWIDFNRSAAFDIGERACATFAAGASSATLTWTVPAATSAGLTYARLRGTYGAATMLPTGGLDSGETEDYSVAIMPAVRVTKVLAAGSSGTVDLKVNGITLATGVGNGGTTGVKTVFDTSTYGAPSVTVPENVATTAVPLTVSESNSAGNTRGYTTTYTCVDATGATLTTGSTTSANVTVPASTGSNGAAQNITCTFTNTQVPSLSLVKSVSSVTDVNGNGQRDAGDRINYSFLVTNTGGSALTTVGVTDPKVTGISCPGTTLALGASMTCTAVYTITQADTDSGSVPNTATAAGKSGAINVTATSSVTATIPANPSLALQKTVASITDSNADGVNDAGDRISWTFRVTNTGNVTVNTVAVTDPKAGAISCPATTLAPGAQTTCTAAQYTITQAEGDAAVVTNTATATGKSPANATVTSNPSSTSTPLVRAPAVTLTKSAAVTDVNANGKTDLGDRIQWSFLVRNTGNVTLTSVNITDAKAGATTCPVTTLAPGASTTCTASTAYTITQADVDAGSVGNTATAGATQPSGATITSAPSTTNTPVVQASALQLTKSAAVTDVNSDGLTDLGDRIQWSFLVRNTGTVTVTTLAVSDPIAGAVTCPVTTLAPGASTTCTATAQRTITQADVDAGVVSNTGTATAKSPSNATITSNASSTATAVTQSTALALLKTAVVTDLNANGVTDLGDRIQWSFKATNTGTVTLTTLAISDAKAGATTCPLTTLAPGASTTCTATVAHIVTQAEVDAGVVNNTATASAKNPAGTTVSSTPSSTSTPVTQVSALTLTKSAAVTDVNADGKTNLGDRIQWSFLVRNTGTVTVTTTAISDAKAGATTCPVTTLAPGASTTCTATAAYPITQADVDAGLVTNTATATAKNPSNATVTSPTSSTSTPVVQVSALTLTKSAAVTDVNADGKTNLGDRIQWSFLVRNTGTVTVTTTAISDAKAGATTCPVTTLAPGASTTCTVTAAYPITQADVDNGVVSNTATASAKNPAGTTVTSNVSQTDTPVNQAPALVLTKSAAVTDVNADGKTNLGDRIQWSFLVRNTGTVTVTTTAISDAKAGATTCPVTTLAPGASTTCTATAAYPITQADVDAGIVNNTATATAKNPSNATVTSNSSSTSTPVVQVSALTLTKTAAVTDVNTDGATDLGDAITWSFLVRNTGTTTINTVAIVDPTAGASGCLATTLAPGASTTCTSGAHTVTQADVDNGVVSNTALATGQSPAGATITSNTSQTDTPIAQTGALQLTKTAAVTDLNTDGATDLGDLIQWSFLVRNIGTTTISNVAVTDAKAGAVSCPVTSLAPGASTTCTATAAYVITQADVDSGVVSNTATASGKTPANATVTSNPSSTNTSVTRSSTLKLVKSAAVTDVNGNGQIDRADTIAWTFQLTNTGTSTLTAASVTDPKAGAVSCPLTTLGPGASTTCTSAAHLISQAEVDAGVVNNTATATATDYLGAGVTSNPSSTSTPVAQTSTVQLTKSAVVTDVNSDAKTDLGDRITWSFLVRNTGTTTLSTVAVNDPKAGSISCPATSLAPGASTTCTATSYTITQADVDAAVVNNTATATAKSPSNATVTSNSSSTSTPVVQTSALQLTKSAVVTDVNSDGKTNLGDRITWSFLVKNTGTVTITGVAVNDAKAGAVTCPVMTLAPGASTTCTAAATYLIKQVDVDAGVVSNTATSSGTKPGGATVTSNVSTTDTAVAQAPALQLTKSAAVTDVNGNGQTDLGDTITWSFLVKNAGTTTIHGIAVTDPKAAPVSCPVTTLAPAATTTCTAPAHSITQADVDAGSVTNTATVAGLDPAGSPITSSPSSTNTIVTQANSLLLTKAAATTDINGNFVIDLGDRVQWTFLVRNTGTATLTTIAVSDPIAGAVTCTIATLTPGSSTTCTATAQHPITQAEVDAGSVNNTATATGKTPSNATVTSNPSSTSTPVSQTPALALTKSASVTDANSNGATDLGDSVNWTFLVQNTGNLTLSTLALVDPKAGAITCPVTSLPPGASTTCSAVTGHTVTQADVDAGVVSNTANASARTGSGATVNAPPSSTDTPVAQASALQLTKSASVTDVNADGKTGLGDTVTWSFLIKNTGTVTVTSLAVNDPKAGSVSCPATMLAPGASTACTSAAYLIVQADVDAALVTNTATATAKDPTNATVTSNPSTSTTPVVQTATLSLVKSAAVTDVNADGKTNLGDRIIWSFLVKNTGSVTLTTVAINDAVAGALSCPTGPLAPGASRTCTSPAHIVTQADVDAGVVNNTATASAESPQNATVTSSPSSTSTPVAQTSTLSLTKSASVTDQNSNFKIDLGDRITWTLLVRNTGTTTINTVAVSDPSAGPVSCPVTTLAPGASTTCTVASHVITQADVDAGIVSNTATASAKDPQGTPIASAPSTADTPVDQSSGLQLTKTALVTDVNANGATDLGDKITWSFLVKNIGSVTVNALAINDPKAGATSCLAITLAPGATTTCTATTSFTITQADVDAAVVNNTATASARNTSGVTVTSLSSSTSTPVAQTNALQLTKSAVVGDVNANAKTDLGDTITWSFLVRNTGTTTVTTVAVTDPKAAPVSCPATTLPPGASTTCTAAARAITQTDVDAGVVSNTATASAKSPSNATVSSNPSSTDTPVAQAPALTLTKSAAVADGNSNGRTDLGDTISWSFLVRNTGTTTLSTAAVADPMAGAVSCPTTSLAPGGSTTCTASTAYSITQPDVDAGHVVNTATATAQTSSGSTVTSAPSSTDTVVAQTPALSVTKSAATLDNNGDFLIDLGDTISWTFLVRNTGTTTMHAVAVNDPKAGAVSCPVTVLAPGASTSCAAAGYPISQADVDAGVVSNTATASGLDPNGSPVTAPPSSTDTAVAQAPALSIVKSAVVTDVDSDGATDLGDSIAWSFVVKNTGTTTITAVAVIDGKAGAVSCPVTTLAPGATTTCTATTAYTITQPDVDAGHVTNTATATATGPGGATVTSAPSSTDTPVVQSPALGLVKSALLGDTNGDGKADLGDTISWSFLVTNTGSTTLSSVAVNDPKAGPVSCPVTTLSPGASTTCTSAAYPIGQVDVDAGVVSNTATAAAQDPQGDDIASSPSSTDTTIDQAPALSLVKSAVVADDNADGRTDLGDTISWSFVVTNTGTTTVSSLAVADPMAGPVTCPVTTLAPGAATTCTSVGAYTITQADVDAGVVDNTAAATSLAPSGATVTSNPSSVSTLIEQRPNPALTKSAAVTDVDGDGSTDLGDTITWSFLVENTGNVTLDSIQVTDPVAGAVTCPSTNLAVGGSMVCTAAAHIVSQTDVDAGVVDNTAFATGHSALAGTTQSNDSSTDTPVDQLSSLSVAKSAAVTDADADGATDLGDTVTWSFLVTNTGTTTLTSVAVDDPKAGAVSCPVVTLAPGVTTSCTASGYTITQADVDAAHVVNTATASAVDPTGAGRTSAPSSTDTPVARTSGITMTKLAAVNDLNADGATDLADSITWSFLVENTGTTTLTGVAVNDAKAGPVSCPVTTLAPGASTTCTATAAYAVVQADVDAGVVPNTATASANDPGPLTSEPSSTDTPVQQVPGLQLTKSAIAADLDGDGQVDLADQITWTFLVVNTGTVTVDAVAVDDPTAGLVTCPAAPLAPGASTTCTAPSRVVSQGDVDAGVVDNTATASARLPNGSTTASSPSSTSTPIGQNDALALVKSAAVADADADGRTDLGDAISWTFLVTNTGTTTLTSVAVADPTAGVVSCPVTTLAPGASTTCTATAHAVTQADVDAGVVSNTATASATAPGPTPVTSAPSSTDTSVDQTSSVGLTKTAAANDVDGDFLIDLGDTITWSFLVSNTGTTTLSSVAVADPVAGPITCPVTTLARGAAVTCTSAAYTITQADVDAGVVANTATASAVGPDATPVGSPPSSTDTPVEQSGALTVTKSAAVTDLDVDGRTDLGDAIAWSFLVRNAGTTTLHAIAVADPTAGPVTCPVTTLAPGASTTCTATVARVVSQGDVDAGQVSNTATASAIEPGGSTLTSPPSSTDTAIDQAPALSLLKSASVGDVDADGRTDLGDIVSWTFLVTNTGTTTLSSVVVTDPTAGPVSCPAGTLSPGAKTTCTAAAYTVGQSDVDAGLVTNTAVASGVDPSGAPLVSPDSSTDTPVDQEPALRLVKSAAATDLDGDGSIGLGDTVVWSFLVTNSGTTSVTGLTIDDPTAAEITCPATTLAPGATTTCTSAAHVVDQADVDAGTVSNTATARGISGGQPVESGPSSTDTPVAQDAALTATKQAAVNDVNDDGKTGKGDTISWTVIVQNTGTVTVHGVAIVDPTAGPMSCATTTLAPGATTSCTAATPYTITQPDVDASQVDNTATATALDPAGAPVSSPPAFVTTPVVSVSDLSLTKQASTFDIDSDGAVGMGDTISWTFLVTNSGSTTLTALTIDDPIAGPVTCPVTTLAPAATTTCTASAPHVVAQVEVDAGDLTNTATAGATDPAGAIVTSPPSSTDTELDQLSAIRLVKHGVPTDLNHDGITDAGDSIRWTFDVTNIGHVTLTGVIVTDTKAGSVTCPVGSLAVGASTTCSADHPYAITTADGIAGAVHNVATATGFCGCRAAVKAVKAAAMVATKRDPGSTAPPTPPAHPSDPVDPTPVVPGLPFTGAMGVAWAIRLGLMGVAAGAFLLIVTRRRDDEDERTRPAV